MEEISEMKIIKPRAEILYPNTDADVMEMYKRIELAGRTCYKSEQRITDDSAAKFIRGLIRRGHEAMIEHVSMTVRFTVDRGVSHEIVRHRIASFAQESTRYCNYGQEKFGNEITVIEPCFYDVIPEKRRQLIQKALKCESDGFPESLQPMTDMDMRYARWCEACMFAEKAYSDKIGHCATPEEARSVLPNSLKTELVMTASLREWRHFFKLRAAGVTGKPHPQMVEVAVPLLKKCQRIMPEVFGDIEVKTDE